MFFFLAPFFLLPSSSNYFSFFVYMRVLAVDVILNRSRPPSFSLYKVPCQILTRWGGKEKLRRTELAIPSIFCFFVFFLFSLTFEIAVEKMFEESREKRGKLFISLNYYYFFFKSPNMHTTHTLYDI